MFKILVIDDNAIVRETLQTVFSEKHECHIADSAIEAIQLLAFENYDLVITDVGLPGFNGLEILGYIQRQYAIPVIVISGHPDLYEAAAVRSGALAFFAKPFRLEELESAVAEALGV